MGGFIDRYLAGISVSSAQQLEEVMRKLAEADRARRSAIKDLRALRAVRSRSLVGELGEALAARFYGVQLEPPSTPGFDLITRDGKRVQVRTLRSTPENKRTTIGTLKGSYDLLFAIRFDEEYRPTEAIEVPREVIEELFGERRVTWTKALEADSRVRRISKADLGPSQAVGATPRRA
jgi:hypothetical protein